MAMTSAMKHGYFNPSALYNQGFLVEKQMEQVRETIINQLHMPKGEVIFTSGGTEANNLAILGYLKTLRTKGRVLYTGVEHSAVAQSCIEAQSMGFTPQTVPVDEKGAVDLAALKALLDDQVEMICVMQVNNEVGTIEPLGEIAALRNQYAPKAAIHVDGVQGFLKVPIDMEALGIQSYALSGHKIHGPKGIGALVKAPKHPLMPLAFGGGQEKLLRSGTENTFGIIGLGAAIEVGAQGDGASLQAMKNWFWQLLKEKIPGIQRLGPQEGTREDSPHIMNIAFAPLRAETLLHALEARQVYVSTGSACAAKKHKMAKTLVEMKVPANIGQCAVRISLSHMTTKEELIAAAKAIEEEYRLLSPYQKR